MPPGARIGPKGLAASPPHPRDPAGLPAPMALLREALARERSLTLFALLLAAAMLPTLVALGLDERTLRGVSVWAKPLKFMVATALFSITTAWFIGLLPPARRRSGALRWLVGILLACASFEIGYITWQAAAGEASHFNVGDPLHGALYTLMGVAALAMTATQPWLAWEIWHHGRRDAPAAWRHAVLAGLILTFVLGATSGMLLSQAQPPQGAGLPIFGWHFGADLRPAHFVGLHAQQLLPLAGLVFAAWPASTAQRALALFVAAYVGAWLVLMALGLGLPRA